jgi:hypothetical protein
MIILGNLKFVQSHANINDLIYNHGTKVILASFSRFVSWMKTFAILDSSPKILLRSIVHFHFPTAILQYAMFHCTLKPLRFAKLNTHFDTHYKALSLKMFILFYFIEVKDKFWLISMNITSLVEM